MPATAGFPASAAANRSSIKRKIRRSGRQACSAVIAGVSRTMSPRERGRMIRISAPCGRLGRTEDASLGFNACFVDEHHRNITANRINAPAGAALQPLLVIVSFTGVLHSGQTKMSSSSFDTAMRPLPPSPFVSPPTRSQSGSIPNKN